MTRTDVAVVGLGAMGSAAAYHLARRGLRVTALDRFAPPHAHGSSHGESRIIREAYFEHPAYVPLVRRAYQEWADLEGRSGRSLLIPTGALMIGAPDSAVVAGSVESARVHDVPHEMLTAGEIRRRFPALAPEPEMVGLLERRAGVLLPEACIRAHLEGAVEAGAHLRLNTVVLGWDAGPEGIRVETDSGAVLTDRLVIAAGPWTTPMLPGVDLRLSVERQVMHWFPPGAMRADAGMPVTLWEHAPGEAFYTIPDLGSGVKAALHHGGVSTTPDAVDRRVTTADTEPVETLARRLVPGLEGPIVRSAACLYTNTPDGHFVIDLHPDDPRVAVLSPCSGHGFKFASAIGAAAADLLTGVDRRDLSFFGIARFAGGTA